MRGFYGCLKLDSLLKLLSEKSKRDRFKGIQNASQSSSKVSNGNKVRKKLQPEYTNNYTKLPSGYFHYLKEETTSYQKDSF